MHQFVAIIDADGASDDTNAEKKTDFFERAKMIRCGGNPDDPKEGDHLQRHPYDGQPSEPYQPVIWRGGVGVSRVKPENGVAQ